MPPGRERLARQQIAAQAAATTGGGLEQAKVTVVSADSPPKVTVKWRGQTYVFPHLLNYTPVVNDVVVLAPYAGSYLILGRPGGFPS